MTKQGIIIGIISIFLGIVLGYFLAPTFNNWSQNQQVSSLEKEFSGLDASECRGTEFESLDGCLSFARTQFAVENMNLSACNNSDCIFEVNRQIQLNSMVEKGDLPEFCLSTEEDFLCKDLLFTLYAAEDNSDIFCAYIKNEQQRSICYSFTESANSAQAAVLPCDLSSDICKSSYNTLSEAVLSNNLEKCGELNEFAGICQQEVLVYQAFSTNNPQICSNSAEPDTCIVSAVLARAQESEDIDICSQLPVPEPIEICEFPNNPENKGNCEIIQSDGGINECKQRFENEEQFRFWYLTQS